MLRSKTCGTCRVKNAVKQEEHWGGERRSRIGFRRVNDENICAQSRRMMSWLVQVRGHTCACWCCVAVVTDDVCRTTKVHSPQSTCPRFPSVYIRWQQWNNSLITLILFTDWCRVRSKVKGRQGKGWSWGTSNNFFNKYFWQLRWAWRTINIVKWRLVW